MSGAISTGAGSAAGSVPTAVTASSAAAIPPNNIALMSMPVSSGLGRELPDLDRRETVNDPLFHLARAERLVEPERGLVPVEHGPLHAPAIAFLRDARERPQKRAADAVRTLRGPHEQVFEIQARPRHESREVEEIQGETTGFPIPFRDQHV